MSEAEKLKAAGVLLVSKDGFLLRVLPFKNIPKKKGIGMTKGKTNPWDCPGGKLKTDETPYDGAMRELEEETGLIMTSVDHTNVHEFDLADCKMRIYVMAVASRLPVKPLDGISKVAWVPIQKALQRADYRLQRSLNVCGHLLRDLSVININDSCPVGIPINLELCINDSNENIQGQLLSVDTEPELLTPIPTFTIPESMDNIDVGNESEEVNFDDIRSAKRSKTVL